MNVLNFELDEFADACTSSSKETNDEVPLSMVVVFERVFEEDVVRVADNVFEKRALLYLDGSEFPFGFAEEIEVTVDGL